MEREELIKYLEKNCKRIYLEVRCTPYEKDYLRQLSAWERGCNTPEAKKANRLSCKII